MSLFLEVPADARLHRFVQLYLGLILFGISAALLVEAQLGLDPWDVFHQGFAKRAGLTIGVATIVTSMGVLLLWIPLRQKPGLGTISNAIIIGFAIDATISLLPRPRDMLVRGVVLTCGIVLNGVATGLYIGAGLGPGPRDGLTTGIAARGHSIRLFRTLIELTVLGAGWLLGGVVGIGTVAYALAIGPLTHVFIPLFTIRRTIAQIPPQATRPEEPPPLP